jgi:hypothetical protein
VGATLVVGLVMLVMMSLLLATAMNLSTASLKGMANMQFRSEAVAAANWALEQRLSSSFGSAPSPSEFDIDIDNDGAATPDYVVDVTPACLRAQPLSSVAPSSLLLPSLAVTSSWNTFWDIAAIVSSTGNNGGAAVEVHEGVRVMLTDGEKNIACP